MIEKSQVLSTVQQIELSKLEFELEALKERVQCQSKSQEQSSTDINSDRLTCKPASETMSHLV